MNIGIACKRAVDTTGGESKLKEAEDSMSLAGDAASTFGPRPVGRAIT